MLTYDLQAGDQPKYYRLYTCIREDILRAELPPGQKLPSKRALAEHLHISLATVSGAYEQLVDEGYLTAKPRSGYYVSAISRLPQNTQPQARLHMLPADAPAAQEPAGYGFRYSALTRLMREVIADCGTRLLEKPPHYGCAELRNAIAEYLLRYRGMLAQPDCIVIGSGAEYLYGLIVQLLGRERVYGLEDPGYEKVRQVYAANGAVCELLPMGEDGVRPAHHAVSQLPHRHHHVSGQAQRLSFLGGGAERDFDRGRFRFGVFRKQKAAADALFHGPARMRDLREHVFAFAGPIHAYGLYGAAGAPDGAVPADARLLFLLCTAVRPVRSGPLYLAGLF